MPPTRRRSPARLFAPLALVIAALAIIVVASSSLGGDDGGRASSQPTPQTSSRKSPEEAQTATQEARSKARPATYTVQVGDTPGAIADDVGLTLDRLLELNPELDANALVAGQKIKLRE